jgi:hypothetical protein
MQTGVASDFAWATSGGFGLLAVLIPSPTAPGGNPTRPSSEMGTVTNDDGSVTITNANGDSFTLGPVGLDDNSTVTDSDGSVTVTGADGQTVTDGPASFDTEAGQGSVQPGGSNIESGDTSGGASSGSQFRPRRVRQQRGRQRGRQRVRRRQLRRGWQLRRGRR